MNENVTTTSKKPFNGKSYKVSDKFFRAMRDSFARPSGAVKSEYTGKWYEVGVYIAELDYYATIMVPSAVVISNPEWFIED